MATEDRKKDDKMEAAPILTFTEELISLKKFLADKELLPEVATRAACSLRTVQYALTVKSLDELKGRKYIAYSKAKALKEEIDALYIKYKL